MRLLPLTCLYAITAHPTSAQEPVPTAPPTLPDVTVSAPEPRYVAPTTRDRIGRIWAPVHVDGRGPYRLVLDTGASHSALTRRVVDDLALPVEPATVLLRGTTGSMVADRVRASTLEVGELLVEDVTLPVVADAFGGADGVLGAQGLRDKRIVIEFLRDRISIARSHRQLPPAGFERLPFRFHPSRGMRVELKVGSVRTIGVIDTGAQRTVGNLALRQALLRGRERREVEESIVGVTQDVQAGTLLRVPPIAAGKLTIRSAGIAFADLHIFESWGLIDKPAVLIGMDVLGVLETLIIDYRRAELHMRTRGGP